jgi:hypothetical protein
MPLKAVFGGRRQLSFRRLRQAGIWEVPCATTGTVVRSTNLTSTMVALQASLRRSITLQAGECQKFCVEGHTASLMAGGLYGGPEGIDRGVVGEPEP